MKKVLRRTALAKRQYERKAAFLKKKEVKQAEREWDHSEKYKRQMVAGWRVIARHARREDWKLGPLAPQRDGKEGPELYGTVNQIFSMPTPVPEHRRTEWGIIEGDRVVLIDKRHPDAGKIGVVQNLSQDGQAAGVQGLNVMDVRMPDHMLDLESDKTPYRAMSAFIPMQHLRLVQEMEDPVTGVQGDVIVDEMTVQTPRQQKMLKLDRPERRIAGADKQSLVGWVDHKNLYSSRTGKANSSSAENDHLERAERSFNPWIGEGLRYDKAKEPEKAFEESPMDTLRGEMVFTQPSLGWTTKQPPIPHSVIDELRNKYGKFRTRHDDEYIAKKEAAELALEARKIELYRKSLTPSDEMRIQRQWKKQSTPRPELDEGILSEIGRVMAKNRGQLRAAEKAA